jgi:sugar phosphate isomerase/epimerase
VKTIKGPAIFLAQFAGTAPHLQNFNDMCQWAKECGFVGVQLPSWDGRVMDLAKAAESKSYCDELKGVAAKHGIEITELAAHLQGQLVAVHPAYDLQFDNFAPQQVHGNPSKRQAWAVEQMKLVARASRNLGLKNCAAFPGALAWPYLYPWPQRPPGLIEAAFDELAKRWTPILDVFKDNGQNCCFEVHPGEDIFDGETFEMFLERVKGHEACQILFDPSHFVLQQLDYLAYIDIYKDRIKMFHVKDAEFRPTGKQGVYSGYQSWVNRAGRFRSLGDGQVDFNGIFSKFAACDFDGWAVLEWECALKHPEVGAREGAPFIKQHIIRVTEKAFDDFAAGGDNSVALKTLGLAK